MPFCVLRKSDILLSDPRGIRRSDRLAQTSLLTDNKERIYDAQISFLIVGTDEWFWTAYCCVDLYYGGNRESIDTYHVSPSSLDAPSGGKRSRQYPYWNPRDYFLEVLQRRIKQVTKEWSNVVTMLEERLESYVCISYCLIHIISLS